MSIDAGVLVGVDVGGTFTDCILIDVASETVRIEKVPSTPEDRSHSSPPRAFAIYSNCGVVTGRISLD
jgi:predicted NBD/HSP70 family sugar kinase